MKEMTKQNLLAAFAGESQAHVKYLIFAEKAEKEGYPNIARLFTAIAHAELVHARNHLEVLQGIGGTEGNLQTAINGENFEVDEMYPAYGAVADLQEEKGAQRSIHFAVEAEKIHSSLYTEAKEAVRAGKDLDIGTVYICPTCGYTVIGDAPDRCPVCGVKKENFKTF
ncbi:MAG: rubrerythrin family protein [Deltaproteobacteria bacterium]|nr:MAG: rubrerythrin family protein [Deltaproteobacteria bacterium]